jgi:hypothetical protein
LLLLPLRRSVAGEVERPASVVEEFKVQTTFGEEEEEAEEEECLAFVD